MQHYCSPFSFNSLIFFLLFSVVQLLAIINSIITLCLCYYLFYVAIAQVLKLKNKLLKALRHQCNAPNWTRGHREPEPESLG